MYNVKPPTRAYKNYNKNTFIEITNKLRVCRPIAYNTYIHYNNNVHDVAYLHTLRCFLLKLIFGKTPNSKPDFDKAVEMMKFYNLNVGDITDFIRMHTFRNEEYRQKFTAKFKKDLEKLTENISRFEYVPKEEPNNLPIFQQKKSFFFI